MDTTSQQRLLGYFIEEAKEHLETLEKGILELSSVMEDNERVNEMFRAAHSIKGGAAMLGYGSIQNTSHRLEDAFKILKDHPIEVDQRLESLFLRAYDVLQDLVERLESSMDLPEDEVEGIMQEAEPYFIELQEYLQQLLSEGPSAPVIPKPVAPEPPKPSPVDLTAQVKELLKQMLLLFKQKATTSASIAPSLVRSGQQEKAWVVLVLLA